MFVICIVYILQINVELCLLLNDSGGGRHGRDRSRSPFSSRRRHQGDRVSSHQLIVEHIYTWLFALRSTISDICPSFFCVA